MPSWSTACKIATSVFMFSIAGDRRARRSLEITWETAQFLQFSSFISFVTLMATSRPLWRWTPLYTVPNWPEPRIFSWSTCNTKMNGSLHSFYLIYIWEHLLFWIFFTYLNPYKRFLQPTHSSDPIAQSIMDANHTSRKLDWSMDFRTKRKNLHQKSFSGSPKLIKQHRFVIGHLWSCD